MSKARKVGVTAQKSPSHPPANIMGLPFFVPGFIPGNRVVIYGSHAGLEAALRRHSALVEDKVRADL